MTALLFLSAIIMQPPECSIAGRVLSASTGEPLKKAEVRPVGPGVPNGLNGARNTTGVSFENRLVGTLQEGFPENVDWKLVLKPDVDAEVAKLP